MLYIAVKGKYIFLKFYWKKKRRKNLTTAMGSRITPLAIPRGSHPPVANFFRQRWMDRIFTKIASSEEFFSAKESFESPRPASPLERSSYESEITRQETK